MAEFQVHGSNAVINALLKALSEQDDCRLAEPGEFTKVAFQNDKIDLLKAESIGDLIHAETELQREQAVKLVQGNASKYYDDLREKLIKSLSYIEAKIDFAEDDLPEKVLKEVQTSVKDVHKDIHKIIEDNKIGEKIRDGFKVSITGEVNAGKSSLLNLIAKRDVAIVSDEAGTTRDVIETYLNIDGYPVILADTAGIREAKNEIEKKGISLALGKSKEADLNIVVIDNSSKTINNEIKKMINMINMKIKTISLVLVSLAFLSVSCNDEFLEIGATGSLAEAQMVTQEGVDGVLIGAYSALNGVFGNRFEAPSHWATGSITGGEFNKGTDPGDYSSLNPVQRYDYPTTQGDINRLWEGRYEGVARANNVLNLSLIHI